MQKQTTVPGTEQRPNFATKAALAVAGATAAPLAVAQDYTAITDAVDWSTVITGIITVLASVAAVLVAWVGGKFLLRAIRG